MRLDQRRDAIGRRQHGFEFVALKSPQADQLAHGRIEQLVGARRDARRIGEDGRKFGRDWNVMLAVGDGIVEPGQIAGLPGVQGAVQTVEFAQYLARRCPRRVARRAGDQYLHTRAENVGFLLVGHRIAAAAERQQQDNPQPCSRLATEHARTHGPLMHGNSGCLHRRDGIQIMRTRAPALR